MSVKSIEWYFKQYGEDWAEIVREEDLRQEKLYDWLDKPVSTFDKSASWAFNEVSGQ